MLQKPAFSTTIAPSVANRIGAEIRRIEKKNSGVSIIFRKLSICVSSFLCFLQRFLARDFLLGRLDDELLPVFGQELLCREEQEDHALDDIDQLRGDLCIRCHQVAALGKIRHKERRGRNKPRIVAGKDGNGNARPAVAGKRYDMVRWEQLPAAIAPDQEYDKAGCFSGSAIEADGKHVLVYTGVTRVKQADGSEQERQNQCIAFGDGKDYVKYEKNPVVTGEMLPEGCSRIDFRDPKIWKENDTYYLIVGNKNDNQVGQVVLCSSKNLTDWKFETILASNENGDIGTMWECPDFFALKDKHVLICSPQDMKARKYEFHNGHNSVYFLGDYDANRCRFSKEQPHTLDYGMDFYAPQTTELPDGRRIMIAWMKSWDACVIPNSQDWQGMMTFPRELEIKENRIWQNPVKELENYYQNPCCYEHTEIEGETVLAGVEGRTIDLTVTLEDGENTIFSIKLAADSEYETSYIYNKETRLLEIDRTYCGVTKDVVCVRKFRIEDPAGLKKMRFILDYHSIELFINDGQQTATTAICTPLNAKDIYFFSDKKMTMSVEKHDIIM